MSSTFSPVYLFADSQLLFWRQDSHLFLKSILEFVIDNDPGAAYLGASNGDNPEFYQLFLAAMESIGIERCRMIPAQPSDEDKDFLKQSSIVLLAGGDVKQGWDAFKAAGVDDLIRECYSEGAVLIGISAGAVQLGTCSMYQSAKGKNRLLTTFQVLPFIIDVHDDQADWSRLKKTMKMKNGFEKGIGIPAGGGFIYHPDHTVEPIRQSLSELAFDEEKGTISSSLLFPGSAKGTSTVVSEH